MEILWEARINFMKNLATGQIFPIFNFYKSSLSQDAP